MTKIFRTIIVLSLTLQIIWFFLPFVWGYYNNEDQLNLLSWAGYDSMIDINGPIPYIILAAFIISSIGLFFFKMWARTFYLVLILFSVISTPIWGFTVAPPIDNVLGYIISLSDGAILAIAYLTKIGSKFE